MSTQNRYVPNDPVHVAVRPLRGMNLSRASHLLEKGEVVLAKNFIPTRRGLKRRPGFTTFAMGNTAEYDLVDMVTFWNTAGAQTQLLITEEFVYSVSSFGGIGRKDWAYSEGAVVGSGVYIIGSGTTFADIGITQGDFITISGTGGMIDPIKIKEVHGNSLLELVSAPSYDYSTSSYQVLRSLKNEDPYLSDWTIHNNELVLCSIKTPLLTYNVSSLTLEKYISDAGHLPATGEFRCNTVTSFLDRVWVGYTYDDTDGFQRQRIRWSKATNGRDFSETTAYYDIPYTSSYIVRMLGMGNILVVYMQNQVYFGRQTGQPLVPLQFSRVETMNQGLVGPKAVVSWMNGHFAVFQDDIYYLSANGAEAIGSKVVRDTIDKCTSYRRVYAVVDPIRDRVVFGFPEEDRHIEKLWSYNYKTEEWGYDEIETYMIASPLINTSLTWADLSGLTWDDLSGYTWEELQLAYETRTLYAERDRSIVKLSDDNGTDSDGSSIEGEVITQDFDLGSPDKLKTATRLSVKVESDETRTNKIEFDVWGSVNKGYNYIKLGSLNIFTGKDEGYIDFALTGSTIRFKLRVTSKVRSFWITEYVVFVSEGGDEYSISTQE